ncbi:dipeptidase PepE [Musicola paradisiaca]|uniref:Peptidase E n=1 Tax=Musicola paradisiaca (strain Ech703) TaxID=579405 RepID=C6C7F6_MUSP7|nr:dipeptidase PepE [Musicola paradisiaca]ACS84074.1 Dipeptidase E [Musicola paradisiaca Ech703]
MELLLLSNSSLPDQPYLQHAVEPIGQQLAGRRKVLFVPFAGVTQSWDAYTDKVRQALSALELDIVGIHTVEDPLAAVQSAEAIMVGGGNTFVLLKQCRERHLLGAIRRRVQQGAPYIGWSAGANLACPSIRTTNDMPIADPGGFDALDLLAWQINPHFTNALPAGHQGETREQRIRELLCVEPALSVIGLPEGNWIQVSGEHAYLAGPNPTWLFRAGQAAQPLPTGLLTLG